MITVKQAVQAAADYLRDVYGEDAKDIRLEETELTDSRPPLASPQWRITLSFEIFPGREYKEFEIDPNSGVVKAMRIRALPAWKQ